MRAVNSSLQNKDRASRKVGTFFLTKFCLRSAADLTSAISCWMRSELREKDACQTSRAAPRRLLESELGPVADGRGFSLPPVAPLRQHGFDREVLEAG